MTVPAKPQSMVVEPVSSPGSTTQSGPNPPSPGVSEMVTPKERSASTMSLVSREWRGREIREGPSESAARTSSRFVRDFEPGIWS